jgi:ABC-type multidrug transport system fused ATPase/permease subunit
MEFSKLVLLNVLDVAVAFSSRYFYDLSSSIHKEYTIHGYRRLDYAAVEKHNDESSCYETLVDVVQDLIDAVELVISSIIKSQLESRSSSKHADATEEFPSNVSPTVEDFLDSVRTACIQVKKQATRIQAYHERRYNLYLSALNIHESHSIRRLTTLATGFLPLSLGASMLSMQTRFADLGLLVYDFVTVGMLLFFLMYTSYILMRVLVRSATWRSFAKALEIMEVSKNRVKELPFWAQGQLSVIVDILPHMTRLWFSYLITLILVYYMLDSSNGDYLAGKLLIDGFWAGIGFVIVIFLVLYWKYTLVSLCWGKK